MLAAAGNENGTAPVLRRENGIDRDFRASSIRSYT
jgi:hypothetical protein